MIIRPGSALIFHYLNHDPPKVRIGIVERIRDIVAQPLAKSTLRRNPDLTRSQYLLTCKMADGTYRAFYHIGLDMLKGKEITDEIIRILTKLQEQPENGDSLVFVPGQMGET